MFAQCPECKTACYISIPELRSTRGIVICKHCSVEFNALESLSDVPAILPARAIDHSAKPLLQRWLIKFITIKSTEFWAAGLSICLLTLSFQFYHYQFDALSQKPKLRPWLISFCQWLTCSIPEYKNPQEISILQGELALKEDNSYQFTSTLTNQAAFPQLLPAVKLSLVNLAGDVVAYRFFYATDYLPSNQNRSIDSNETIQITLHIAPITTAVGGYYFELV